MTDWNAARAAFNRVTSAAFSRLSFGDSGSVSGLARFRIPPQSDDDDSLVTKALDAGEAAEAELAAARQIIEAALAHERAMAGDQFDMAIQYTHDALIHETKAYRDKYA